MERRAVFVLIITILLSSPLTSSAVQVAPRITDREIVERLTRLEEGQKALNKRIDGLDKSLNERINDLDKKLNKRIDDLDKKLNGRIDGVNKRIDDVNRRIDDLRAEMNGRFDTLQWMFGVFITISLVIMGFVLRMQWQMQKRQTSLESTLKAHEKELAFLKGLIEKLLPPRGVL